VEGKQRRVCGQGDEALLAIADAVFGQETGVGTPRTFQLGLRFDF
jgi:hypothetical protein